jgi:hypothetical protein
MQCVVQKPKKARRQLLQEEDPEKLMRKAILHQVNAQVPGRTLPPDEQQVDLGDD